MTAPRPSRSEDDAGQTLPDFVVGVAIFLLAVTFVAVLVPQLLLPFDDQERPVVAERITTELGTDVLTERDTRSQLNESGTRSFFALAENEALETLGVEPWYSLNVTLRNASSSEPDSVILCESDGGEWIDDGCADPSDRFAIGDPVPRDRQSVSTGRRAVFAGETDVVLEVRVW